MSAQPERAAKPPKAPETIPGAEVRVSPALIGVLIILTVLGVVGFVAGLLTGNQDHVWRAYLVNFVFWLGIAEGGIAISAAFYLTQGRWGGPGAYRLAESFYLFIPLAFVLFWGLFFGRIWLWPWVTRPIAHNPVWLNVPFFFAREGAALLILALVSLWFVRLSRRVDVRQWALTNEDITMPPAAMRRVAVVSALVFVAVFSLIAFDLVMSLAPDWYSTLFGWFFFGGAFWSAVAAMSFVAVVLGRRLGPGNLYTRGPILHDLGKFLFAFSVFWAYLLFAQYIVIWYGDIPRETFFLVVRGAIIGGWYGYTPWMPLSWGVFLLVFIIPFTVLMGARPKQTPAILGPVALLGLVGMWMERYVLVVPSLRPYDVSFGWVDLLITLGFLGLFGLCSIPGMKLTVASATSPEVLEAAEK